MSDYTKIVDYAAKDALLTGNPAKLVKGTEIGAEFDAIVTAVATKVDETGGAATNLTLTTPILGTPQSGTVTNLTGTASININGTVGATTPAAGAFTTLSATTPLPITSGGTGANSDATARSALSAAASGANSDITSLIGITGPINEARGSVAMHATTMDLWAQPNIIDGTSTAVTITAIANAPQAGARRVLYPVANSIITNGATFSVDGAANATAAAGDAWEFEAVTTSTYKVHIVKKDGTAVVGGSVVQIQPISASVGASALTISASALSLEFRSATLGSGTVSSVSGTPANLVISSGSTLGTVSAQQSRIAVLALNNAGTIELAVVNMSGGTNLDETGVISTTAEGGAGAADSASVVYSTTARSSLAYRVIGYVESTQATAGTWATAPSTIQGQGGQALAAMSSIGYGQTWQVVTGSRASGTTYYNTTGRPILLSINFNQTTGGTLTVNGVTATSIAANAIIPTFTTVIPPSASYAFTAGSGISSWSELR